MLNKNKFKFFLIIVFLFFPFIVKSTSGACSHHGGIDCSRGMQIDGKVYCNDGWEESSTYFRYAEKCNSSDNDFPCPVYLPEDEHNQLKGMINKEISEIESETEQRCNNYFERDQRRNDELYVLCLEENESKRIMAARTGREPTNLKDCEYNKEERTEENKNSKELCMYQDDEIIWKYQNMLACLKLEKDYCEHYFENSFKTSGGDCKCKSGFKLNSNKTGCVKVGCPDNSEFRKGECKCIDGYIWTNDKCVIKTIRCEDEYKNSYGLIYGNNDSDCRCLKGFEWNAKQARCIKGRTETKNSENSLENNKGEEDKKRDQVDIFLENERRLSQSEDKEVLKQTRGKILIQVEENGAGWYVNPEDSKKYYLGKPANAFKIMRKTGNGISEKDFKSFNGYAPVRLSGTILIRVEANGEAYYVNPESLKMHYLGRPSDAFKVMRDLGLGISNKNIRKIKVGEL